MFGGGGECGASILLQEEEVSERASGRGELRELSEVSSPVWLGPMRRPWFASPL